MSVFTKYKQKKRNVICPSKNCGAIGASTKLITNKNKLK